MKAFPIYFLLLVLVFSCNNQKTVYKLIDKDGNTFSYTRSKLNVGEYKYLVNYEYDSTGWMDLVEDNDLPQTDTTIIHGFSKHTGKPRNIIVKKFLVSEVVKN